MVSFYMLFIPTSRPESQQRWEEIIAPQLEMILGISLDPSAVNTYIPPEELPKPQVYDPSVMRSSVVRWTLNSKTSWIDQLCEIELRDDDVTWFVLNSDVAKIIDQTAEAISEEVIQETVAAVVGKLLSSDEGKSFGTKRRASS